MGVPTSGSPSSPGSCDAVINVLFAAGNVLATVAANALLKLSAEAASLWPFLLFQVAGNLLGLLGVLAYTGLIRKMPMHVAFPLTRGLCVLGVQLGAAALFFREPVTPRHLAGAALVTAGIVLVGLAMPARGRAEPGRSRSPGRGGSGGAAPC